MYSTYNYCTHLHTGLLTAVRRDHFRIINYRELLFNDFGDRVAQLLHVESVVPVLQGPNSNIHAQIIIVNTHLLFPHDSSLCIVRLQQVHQFVPNSFLFGTSIGTLSRTLPCCYD